MRGWQAVALITARCAATVSAPLGAGKYPFLSHQREKACQCPG